MGYNDFIPSSNTMINIIMFMITWSLLMIPFAFPNEEKFVSYNYHCNLTSNLIGSSGRVINEDYISTLSATASELINKTASSGGYFYTSHTVNGEKTYGLAICLADIPDANCTACVEKATTGLIAKCGYTSGIIYEPRCVFKYSNVDFEKEVDIDPLNGFYTWTPLLNHTLLWVNSVSAEITRALMTSLIQTAIESPPTFYASGNSKLINETGFDFVYGMAMCNRGLPDGGCKKCFDFAFTTDTLSDGFDTTRTGYLGLGSCTVRYSTVDFLSN